MSHKISIHRVIGNFVGNLDIDNVNNIIPDLARWACEAVSKIGSTNSYIHKECELEIKGRKAKLPVDFAYLTGLKYKNKQVNITKRQFRMFNKGSGGSFSINDQQDNTVGGNIQVNKPGVPSVNRITFTGVFLAGEIINITIVMNDCGNINTNVFTYVVQAGDTPQDIANAFLAQFNAIANLPFTATIGTNSVDVTALTPEVILTFSVYEDSIGGTVTVDCIQARVAPVNRVVNSNSGKKTPKFSSDNLANSDVYKLNTGMTAQNRLGEGNFGGNYDFGPSEEVFALVNGWIHFNAYDDQKIGISYQGIECDEEGWPLIYWEHEDAVTHYLQWMYLSRRYYNGKLAHHIYKEAELRWKDLCGQARGDDELPNEEEIRYLANMWNQLLPLPNKNFF